MSVSQIRDTAGRDGGGNAKGMVVVLGHPRAPLDPAQVPSKFPKQSGSAWPPNAGQMAASGTRHRSNPKSRRGVRGPAPLDTRGPHAAITRVRLSVPTAGTRPNRPSAHETQRVPPLANEIGVFFFFFGGTLALPQVPSWKHLRRITKGADFMEGISCEQRKQTKKNAHAAVKMGAPGKHRA